MLGQIKVSCLQGDRTICRRWWSLARQGVGRDPNVVDSTPPFQFWAMDNPDGIGLWVDARSSCWLGSHADPFWSIDYVFDRNAGAAAPQIIQWAMAEPSGCSRPTMANRSGSSTRLRSKRSASTSRSLGFASQADVGGTPGRRCRCDWRGRHCTRSVPGSFRPLAGAVGGGCLRRAAPGRLQQHQHDRAVAGAR